MTGIPGASGLRYNGLTRAGLLWRYRHFFGNLTGRHSVAGGWGRFSASDLPFSGNSWSPTPPGGGHMQLLGRIILERVGDVKWELVHSHLPPCLVKIHPLRCTGEQMMWGWRKE
jgi:hypothetical protein